MHREIKGQHPIFIRYTRAWLHRVTGFSRGYLCRLATGKSPLSRSFIERVCFRINQPEEELFHLRGSPCLVPGGCATSDLGGWLQCHCAKHHLSLRQAAIKTGLSHATIADIINGHDYHPHPETIRKLARGFGGDGKEGLALEDHLLTIAGYRTERPAGEEPSVAIATLMDKLGQFSAPELEIMERFADFLIEIR